MTVRISSKYQVVIPKEVRESLGLKKGTPVSVIAKGGIAYIVPQLPLSKMRGFAKELRGKINAGDIRDKKDREL